MTRFLINSLGNQSTIFNIENISKLPFITLSINKKILKFLIDTGADKSYISPDVVNKKFRSPTNLNITSLFNSTTINEKTIIKFNEFDHPIELFILKFHKFYDGLLGYENLTKLNANVLLETKQLKSPNFSLKLHDKIQSCIKPFFLNALEKVIIRAPVSIKNGEFYIKPIKIQEGVYIQEGIYKTHSPHSAYVEIINQSSTSKEIFLIQPITVEELNQYHEIHFHTSQEQNSTENNESKLDLANLNREEKQEIIKLCNKFKDIFYDDKNKLTFTHNVKHKIDLNNEKPVHVKQYRHPEYQKSEIKNEINKLLSNGIIRPSYSPWSSPIWLVPKKADSQGNKKWRLVVDYRKLNSQTIDDRYPLPNISNILDKLGKANYFSTIDLAAGFHQIQIHPNDIPKTGFSVESGHYEFLRMPFGLKNAPSTFQRIMDNILGDLQGNNVLCYMDDIIVFSTSLQEHIIDLQKVFIKLRNANLKIQVDKTHFCQKQIGFLGHIITPEGVKPNPSKIEAIKNINLPKTQKEIKSFLGLIGYYRKFIKDFAKITKPLTSCLTKKSKIVIDDNYKNCFDLCKSLLTNEPILKYPDFEIPFTLTTDASNFAIGAILSQGEIGKDLPIAYASRTLSKTETNYATIEKELLAIVWGVKYFRPYLYGRKFNIVTDHKPLVWLFNAKDPSSKIVRWRLRLEEYDYEILYKKGTSNTNADALSRIEINECLANKKFKYPETIDSLKQINSNEYSKPVENSIGTQVSKDEKNTQHEINMLELMDNFQTLDIIEPMDKSVNIPETLTPINNFKRQIEILVDEHFEMMNEKLKIKFSKYKQYTIRKKEYTPEDIKYLAEKYINNTISAIKTDDKTFKIFNDYFKQNPNLKIVRSKNSLEDITDHDKQLEIIKATHIPYHRGIIENFAKIKKIYFFPNLKLKVTRFVNNCDVCKLNKYERKPVNLKFLISPTPNGPMEILHCDTFVLRSKTFLTIMDKFSKFISIFELPNRKSQTIIRMFRKFFSREGIPKQITIDSATEFNSEIFNNFMSMHNIELHTTTAKSSTGNSPIERVHNTLTELIRIIHSENKDMPICELMDEATFAYNNSIHSATSLTPFELHKGHIIIKNIPENFPEQSDEFLETIRKKYQRVSKYIAQLQLRNKTKNIKALNTERDEPRKFFENQTIFEKTTTRDKLVPKYIKHLVEKNNEITVDTNKRTVHKRKIRNCSEHINKDNILLQDTPGCSRSNNRTLRPQ